MKRASTGRADLLAWMSRHAAGGEAVARVFGFERKRDAEQPEAETSPPVEPQRKPDRIDQAVERVPTIWNVPPPVRPRLGFLMATRTETFPAKVVSDPPGDPITDQELAVPWGKTAPPTRPLIPWARLGPFLKRRLGRALPGPRLDERRLLRRVGKGLPLGELPRRPRGIWSEQILVLRDVSWDMSPFHVDSREVCRRLEREHGKHGLTFRQLRGLPDPALAPSFPVDRAVLVLSALGQGIQTHDPEQPDSGTTRAAWQELGRCLEARGVPRLALVPVPRDRWSPDLADVWPSVEWDRWSRLPRRGGADPIPSARTGRPRVVDELLDCLSPASRIESALLREARLRLGRVDVGVEYDAWFHSGGWSSEECFGFRPGGGYDERLARRAAWAAGNPEDATAWAELIRRHHEHCSIVVAAEAELRACLTGGETIPPMEGLEKLLERIVDRLRRLAKAPGSGEVRTCGLATWFVRMLDRLSPVLRADDRVARWLARGLALAHASLDADDTVIPEGTDRDSYAEETRQIGVRQGAARECRIVLRGADVVLVGAETTVSDPEMFLARMTVDGDRVQVRTGDPRRGQAGRSVRIRGGTEDVVLVRADPAGSFDLESARQRLWFESVTRPGWAERMAYDRFGIRSEFTLGGIAFVMRWIPAGRFRMGSPDDEPGRSPNESPRHEVTITRGFWIGETPVTQAQWRAVAQGAAKSAEPTADPTRLRHVARTVAQWVGKATGGKASKAEDGLLEETPSRFVGPADLPVEQASWHDCRRFVDAMNGMLMARVPEEVRFRLPSEAEWEYACRAGTETAIYTGGMTLKGENHAPELDEIAWYGGNSGQGLEVKNPYDSEGWPDKQYGDEVAGTHRVKLKRANPWGLYDTLGNVWEWCWDGLRTYHPDMEEDPVGPLDEGAVRVARGGSWDYLAGRCRAASRIHDDPGYRGDNLGFRLVAGQELPSGAGGSGRQARSAGAGGPRPATGGGARERKGGIDAMTL